MPSNGQTSSAKALSQSSGVIHESRSSVVDTSYVETTSVVETTTVVEGVVETTSSEVVAVSSGIESLSLSSDISEGSEATHLVRCLIRIITCDIGGLKRNTQTAYYLVNKAREVYSSINAYISQVEHDSSKNIWDNYDMYIGRIRPLESILFQLLQLTKEESGLDLNNSVSVSGYMEFVTKWVESMTRIRQIGATFCTEFGSIASGLEYQIQLEYRNDDLDLLRQICYKIQHHKFEKVSSVKVRETISKLQLLASTIPSLISKKLVTFTSVTQTLITMTIKSTMFFYGVIYVSSHTKNRFEREILLSETTWGKVERLISIVTRQIEIFDGKAVEFSEIEQGLEVLVIELKDEIPERYRELRKRAHYIGPRFHAQTGLLLEVFRHLELDYYEDKKNGTTVLDREQLIRTIGFALTALDDAIDATRDPETPVVDAKVDITEKAFFTAYAELKKCFSRHVAAKWSELDVSIKASKSADWARADKFKNEILKKCVQVRTQKPAGEEVPYRLVVHVGGEVYQQFEGSAQSGATVALLLSQIRAMGKIPAMQNHPSWEFRLPEGDVSIGLNRELKTVPSVGGQRTLYLQLNK